MGETETVQVLTQSVEIDSSGGATLVIEVSDGRKFVTEAVLLVTTAVEAKPDEPADPVGEQEDTTPPSN